MVSPGSDVGVNSQDEDRNRGLSITGSSGDTENRVQAASEWEDGQDDHRDRDPGGIVASPLVRGPSDSSPCARIAGDAGREAEEYPVLNEAHPQSCRALPLCVCTCSRRQWRPVGCLTDQPPSTAAADFAGLYLHA